MPPTKPVTAHMPPGRPANGVPSTAREWGIWLLAVLFFLLGNLYGLITPVFEASDELFHYPYVHHLVSQRRFPIQDPQKIERWRQEGGQPPLYYLIAAAATLWIDTDDLPQRMVYNPHAQIGVPLAPTNKNMVIHTPIERFPYRGTVLAVHLIRLLSTLMGAGTVLLTYWIAREVFPDTCSFPLLAASVTAFNPMFLFVSASVNNDNLAVLLCSLALWQMVRIVRVGATAWRIVGLALVAGLGILTKMSALGLLPLIALVITWDAWKQRSVTSWLKHGLLAAGLVAAVGGWWYLRNWLLYGDPLGFNVWLAIAGSRELKPGLGGLLDEFEGFRISYWGLFGGVNILMHPWIYLLYDLLGALACAGILWSGFQWILGHMSQGKEARAQRWRAFMAGNAPRPLQMVLLGLWLLILVSALVRWTQLTPASQGRLIFPGITAGSFWLAFGWRALAPQRLRPVVLSAVAATLLLIAIAVPWAFIAPAYAMPMIQDSLPESLQPVRITFGDQLELVGYWLPDPELKAGETMVLELGWRAQAPMDKDYSIFVHLYGPDGEFLGQADTYPGGGMLPTSHWSPGDQLLDTIYVPTQLGAPSAGSAAEMAPGLGRIVVGLYHLPDMAMLPARDAAGADLGTSPTIGRFKVMPSRAYNPTIPQASDYQFGPKLALIGYDLSAAPGAVTLYWQAKEPIATDFTVFVHLVDGDGQIVAQMDGPPREGKYPTSWWGVGEVIVDRHALPAGTLAELPPGEYHPRAGLYKLETGERLPVTLSGAPMGDHVAWGPISWP